MGDKIAMGRPGTQFSGDGISLSWPRLRNGEPGIREVIEVPPGKRSGRVNRMILEGAIVETDLEVTNATEDEPKQRVFEGGSREALRRMREPAGPVIRRVFVPVGELEDKEITTLAIEEDPDADRRPATAIVEEPEPEPEPELSFEERVDEMADNLALSTLQRKAREFGLKSADLSGGWGDKHVLASEILKRQDAAADESGDE